MDYVIAVDSGGTFTDAVIITKNQIFRGKAPSTPEDFSMGVLNAVANANINTDRSLDELFANSLLFGHGTTVSTNALVTRSGVKTGILTTRGHEDALIIGRVKQKVAGLTEDEMRDIASLTKAVPIVPRTLIKGVAERMDCNGSILAPLDRENLISSVDELLHQGVKAIAVCYLWSFVNPSHEKLTKQLINQRYPDIFVSISSELVPVIKEYERIATTSLNAYLSPVCQSYLQNLASRLAANQYEKAFYIMSCSGGVISYQEASQSSILTLESGPVGGVIGAAHLGKQLGYNKIITSDVGGTTFDVGLVINQLPQYSPEPIVDKYHILIPMIDIVSIGAGAGSIAWIEQDTGILKVGPKSAGSVPGPVCYDKGGLEPTVADADLVLGRLNPSYFLGGQMPLNKAKAEMAIKEKIARPLGLSVPEAAMAITNIIDAHMADLLRKVTVGRGYDPRDFVLFSFGGAGPTHVGSYAADIGVRTAVIPYLASVFSAFGIAQSDMVQIEDLSKPMIMPFDTNLISEIFRELKGKVLHRFGQSKLAENSITMQYSIEMRFRGQVHSLHCPVPEAEALGCSNMDRVIATFEQIYDERYGQGTAYREAGVEISTFRAIGTAIIPKTPLPYEKAGNHGVKLAIKEERPVFFQTGRNQGEFILTPIYDFARLLPGCIIQGPAVIESVDTTIVIHPRQESHIDEYLNCILKVR